jgi:hypothetical protein
MGLGHPKPGFNSVSEYSIAGLPWVTSSVGSTSATQRWDFPKITKQITVGNSATSGTLAVGFTDAGMLNGHTFLIPPSGSETFDVRAASLFVRANDGTPRYSIFASLTFIDKGEMPPFSGSNGAWEGVS